MSYGIIAGSVIGAGATVGGALLSRPKNQKSSPGTSFNPASDPLTTFNMLDLLASQGIGNPGASIELSGPIQQAINAYSARTPVSDVARKNLLRGKSGGPGSEAIAKAAGYANVAELFAAQKQWEEDIAPRLAELRQIATLSGSRQVDVEKALRNLASGPLDLNALREAELVRLNRDLDTRQTQALRSASAGGFNPGGALEGIERLRNDADLEALTRAVGYLQGQGQSIQNLQALNPANRAQQFGPGATQFRLPNVSSPNFAPQTVNPFGAAVASAGQQLGGTLSTLALLNQLNQQKPGAAT